MHKPEYFPVSILASLFFPLGNSLCHSQILHNAVLKQSSLVSPGRIENNGLVSLFLAI